MKDYFLAFTVLLLISNSVFALELKEPCNQQLLDIAVLYANEHPSDEASTSTDWIESIFFSEKSNSCTFVFDATYTCDALRYITVSVETGEVTRDLMDLLGTGGWCDY